MGFLIHIQYEYNIKRERERERERLYKIFSNESQLHLRFTVVSKIVTLLLCEKWTEPSTLNFAQ